MRTPNPLRIPCDSRYEVHEGKKIGKMVHAIEITPTIARQIVAMAATEESSAVVKESLTAAPAATVDYEAAENAMIQVIGSPEYRGVRGIATDTREKARCIIAAIRRGEVPGITTLDKCSDLIAEHAGALNQRDAAIARAERAEAELNRCAGPLVPKELLTEARGAHAEAVELLGEARHHIRIYGHDINLVELIDAHLAKHKEAGK